MSVPPSRSELLERERRRGRLAGLAAVLGGLMVAASFALQSVGLDQVDTDAEQLTQIHDHSGRFIAAGLVGALGISLFSLPLFHLFEAARARTERVRRGFVALVFIGPILFGVGQLMAAVGASEAADKFTEQEATVQATETDLNQ